MNPYYEQKILNSEPMELIRFVYQRAIACVREAREHLRKKRIAERSTAIMRAYAAIAQLIAALDPEAAPELCHQLQNLYAYMQKRLLAANFQQAEAPLTEVLSLLTTLSEAWSGVAAQLASNGAAKPDVESGALRRGDPAQAVPGYAMSA